MTDKKLVLTTAGSEEEAHRIAKALVERKLAACVSIFPRLVSVYRWKESIEQSEEWQLWIKTTAQAFPLVRDAIKQLHSYDLPECMCLIIDDGSTEYLQWMDKSLR